MNTSLSSPYVGPRTFLKEEGYLFFGRDREARDLSALVTSEKLVLFYAQSGAGKSSLINTRLIPELEEKLYEVLPVGRVSGDLPADIVVDNVYSYNLMRSVIRRELEPASLAHLSISQFQGRLNEDEQGYFYDASLPDSLRGHMEQPWRRALIIDQFEELFSTHHGDWEKREDFFMQIAKAMEDDPYLWVILVMREDYIAALDPYAHLLPGGLRTRYYMQRLGKEAALKAVKSPVENLRPYADGVAETLVENLATIKVQKPDGSLELRPGQFVEPVQLQVVCHSLWENLASGGTQITANDLEEVGDIDQSLQRYYGNRVSTVAEQKRVSERQIREWFDKELITSSGTRNLVLRENSTGLEERVIQALQGDLVRAEMRAGQLWYELSHDRLIEPVRKSNALWFEQNLSLFQRQVIIWLQQGRSEGLLFRGDALHAAEEESKTLILTRDEEAFLTACRREQNRTRFIRMGVIAQMLTIIVLAVFMVSAFKQSNIANALANDRATSEAKANINEATAKAAANAAANAKATAQADREIAQNAQATAEVARDQSLASSLAAQADSLKNSDHALALLLSAEAYTKQHSLLTRTTLFNLLQYTPYTRLAGSFDNAISSIAVSPKNDLFVAASCKETDPVTRQCKSGKILLFKNIDDQEPEELTSNTPYGYIYSLAFYQYDDMLVLAAAGCVPVNERSPNTSGCKKAEEGQLTLWNINAPDSPKLLKNFELKTSNADQQGLVKTIAFNQDGSLLASGSYDGKIILWNMADRANPQPYTPTLKAHTSFVNSIAFSPSSEAKNILVSVGDDRKVIRWEISIVGDQLSSLPNEISKAHNAPINKIAFAPDGKLFATASDDATIKVWDVASEPFKDQNARLELKGHASAVKGLAYYQLEDTLLLASAGFDNKILLWNANSGEQLGPALSGHTRPINAVAFSAQSPRLFSVSDDRTIIQWDLTTFAPLRFTLQASTDIPPDVSDTTIDYEAQANNDQSVSILKQNEDFLKLEGFENLVSQVLFSADGQSLFTIEANGHSMLWTINPETWLKRACEIVKRSLTEDQRKDYEACK